MNKKLFYTGLIFLATLIWGFGFVAQSNGIDKVGPFLFIGVRMSVATIVLIPVYRMTRARTVRRSDEEERESFWLAAKAGVVMGILMLISMAMQLTALAHMTAGKNAFLCSMFVAVVPFIMLAMGQKSLGRVWIGVVLAVIGMFFLSVNGDSMAIAWPDLLAAGTAIFSALVNIITGEVANRVNSVLLVLFEALAAGVGGLGIALFVEPIEGAALMAALPAILYMALMGTCLGFTLQAVGQKEVDPAVTSILTSLTSVFAVLFGFLFLDEMMTGRELLGGAFVVVATIVSGWPKAEEKSS